MAGDTLADAVVARTGPSYFRTVATEVWRSREPVLIARLADLSIAFKRVNV